MASRPTTICCSAGALAAAVLLSACATVSTQTTKVPSLFPLRTAWTLPLGAPLRAPAVFHEARAFFPLDGDKGGQLAAYDLQSGQPLWSVPSVPLFRPAMGDELLFIATTDGIAALQQADGAVRWRLPLSPAVIPVPLVSDSGWLIATTDAGSIIMLRGSDGHRVWTREIGAPVRARPALGTDRVFLPVSNGHIVALRLDNGEPLWEKRLGGAPNEMLALGDRVYVGANDKLFYCLRASDGIVLWSTRTGAAVVDKPAADDGHVFFTSLDNLLRAVNPRTGSSSWTRPRPLGFRTRYGPIAVRSLVAVGGQEPVLHVFRAADGQPAGDIAAPATIASEPYFFQVNAFAPPTVVLVTQDIDKGATVVGLVRSYEPTIVPLASLPGLLLRMPGAGMPVLPTAAPQP